MHKDRDEELVKLHVNDEVRLLEPGTAQVRELLQRVAILETQQSAFMSTIQVLGDQVAELADLVNRITKIIDGRDKVVEAVIKTISTGGAE